MLRKVSEICAWPGRYAGWLLLPLILSVYVAVWATATGVNALANWEGEAFLLSGGITVNSLLDLQWHVFAVLVLFGGVLAFRDNAHVSVDFISARFPPRLKRFVQVVGDLVFLLPFCIIMTWYGTKFALTAFNSGEGSSYGGLSDRWLIKACLPVAFALLGVAGLARVLSGVRALVKGEAR